MGLAEPVLPESLIAVKTVSEQNGSKTTIVRCPQKVNDKKVFCSPTSFTVRDWILSKHQEVAQNDKIADKKSQVRVLKQKIRKLFS